MIFFENFWLGISGRRAFKCGNVGFKGLKDKQASNKKIVLAEHVAALGCTKVGEKKYEPATLVRAFEYFALSRTSYRQLRDDFELPSISTLTRLTSAIKNLYGNDYLHNMFFCLRDLRKKKKKKILKKKNSA